MGNCCHAETPCGSLEERSGLLKNDSKATVSTGEKVKEDTYCPDGDDGMRIKQDDDANIKVEEKVEAVQTNLGAENGEMELNYTQENRPLMKESIQTAMASPCKKAICKENSTRAQDEDMKEHSNNKEQTGLSHCTLNSNNKAHPAAPWEVFTETNLVPEEVKPTSVKDRISVNISPKAESASPEKPSHTETTSTTEHITMHISHNDTGEEGSEVTSAVAEPSGEFSEKSEVSSVPNTQLSAAPAQVISISAVTQEINKEATGCAVREDSDNGSSSVCKQVGPEDIKSHDVSASPPGSDPTGLSHSGEEQQPSNSVRESETTALADAMESSKSEQNTDQATEVSSSSINQDTEEDTNLKVQNKNGDVPKAKEEDAMETETQAWKNTEMQEVTGKEEQPAGCTATDVTVDVAPVTEKEESVDSHLRNSEEDLYRGEEELSQNNKPGQSVFETTCLKVEDRCSLAPAVNILSYSEREWKGNTAKSALIRKGYKEMAQRFSSVRRVRGDNYCALRATLFQVLSHSTHLPVCLQCEDIAMLPKPLEAQEALISQWTFPGKCLQGDGTGDVTQQLKSYMELLRNKWQAAVDCPSDVERQQLCERVFQGGEEELGLLEALKLLMLARAVELHSCMQEGGDVPLFCWLLFARDSSDCPRSFLSNHLRHVGLTAGLEQVEMFLLGYALECTIQVYRLYKADTEEFVTYYPDDHKDDWPTVSLVTEDDRHYNVPVVEAEELHMDLYSS